MIKIDDTQDDEDEPFIDRDEEIKCADVASSLKHGSSILSE